MSEERRPPTPQEEVPAPEHHLAQEIREEIEEIVEHVPRPVRWTVGKLFLLAALSLFGLVVVTALTAVLYVANRTEWAAQELALVTNRLLAPRSDLLLELDDIKGNFVTGVRLIKPRLVYRDAPGRAPLLQAREVRLRYPPWVLMAQNRSVVEIELDRPELWIECDAQGRLMWPRWKAEERREGGSALRRWTLRLRQGNVRLGGPEWQWAGIEGLVVGSGAPAAWTEVSSMRWQRGPYASGAGRLSARIRVADSLQVELRELEAPEYAVRGRGALYRTAPAQGEFALRFQHVRFAWLADVFRNQAFDVPGDMSGALSMRSGPTWSGQFTTRASWDSLPVQARGTLSWGGGQLQVAPLQGSSPAGDLQGRLFWSRDAWRLTAAAQKADPSHWGVIGLEGWPEGRLSGQFDYQTDTRRHQARLIALLSNSELSGWRADTGRVDAWFPAGAPDSFQVRALRRGGEMQLAGRSAPGGWRGRFAVSGLPLEEWPDGRTLGIKGRIARGEGKVVARNGALAVEGVLNGESVDWLGTRAGGWRLDHLRGTLLPGVDLTGDARLENVLFVGTHLDTVTGPFHLAGDSLRISTSRAVAGDTLLVGAGVVSWGGKGWCFESAALSGTSPRFEWRNDGPVVLRGDAQGTVFERFQLKDGDASLRFSGRWAGPQGAYDWQAFGTGLDLARVLGSEIGAQGRMDAELRVWGASGAPRWELRGRGGSVGFQGHRADSVSLQVTGAPYELRVQDGELWLGGGRLALQGVWSGTERDWPDSLVPSAVRRWLAHAQRWEGSLRAERFPLDRAVTLVPAWRAARGQASGELSWTGSPQAPRLALEATVEAPAWESYSADRARVSATYADGQLRVSRGEVSRQEATSDIEGSMPLKLDLEAGRASVPDAPIDWKLKLPRGDLALLSLMVPQIGYAAGSFDLDVTLRGTTSHPDVAGTARIRGGKVRLATREELLEDLSADFTLDESRVTLDTLRARESENGRVAGKGVVELSGFKVRGYRFDLALRNFRALESGLYVAEFDGDFSVHPGPRRGRVTLPSVQGRMNLKRAAVLFDFTNQSEVQQLAATTRPLYWLYNIRLEAKDGLRWRPPDADIEFSADLALEQTLDSLLVYGEVHALRGTYFFLSNRFKIEDAVLVFDNVGGVDPQLDIRATTRVPGTAGTFSAGLGPSEESNSVDITAVIQGRASNPTIQLSSSNDWDQPTVLRALTYGQFIEGGRVAIGDPLENYLTRVLSRQLDEPLSAAFGGYLQEWELSREQSGAFHVGVGAQLTRELSLRYRQALPGYTGSGQTVTGRGLFERDVEAEYRLNRFVYLTTGLAQRRGTAAVSGETSTTTDFNVNLKVRFEY